jgi:NTF2 fold immunity protein
MRAHIICIMLVATVASSLSTAAADHQKKTFVADEAIAIKIAYAAFKAKYDDVTGPYHATLKDGIWTVDSTFQTIPGIVRFGGPAHAQIRQKDSKLLKMWHEE